MSTKTEKLHAEIAEAFKAKLNAAFLEKFNVTLTTSFNIFSMSLVSVREDGANLTAKQRDYIATFGEGYRAAENIVFWKAAHEQDERWARQAAREEAREPSNG